MTARTWTAGSCALLGALAIAPSAAGAARKDALTVANPPASVAPGGQFTARVSVARPSARKLSLTLVLSRDARRSRDDLRLRGALKLRRDRKGALRGSRRVLVPAGASGRYRLLACRTLRRRGRALAACAASRRSMVVATVRGLVPMPHAIPPQPGPGTDPAVPNPAPPRSIFTDPPNPAAMKVAFDRTRSSRAHVQPDDDEDVSVTAADGTRYRLDLPEGAVLSETDVTLIPAATVEGLPFAATPARAVLIEPAGLRLQRAAKLTITPPAGTDPLPAAEQAGVFSRPDGSELRLAPVVPSTPAMDLALGGLGVAGIAKATPAEVAAFAPRLPTERADRLEHVYAAGTPVTPGRQARARESAAAGDPGLDALRHFFRVTVSIDLDQAVADVDDLPPVLTEIAGWLSLVYFFGHEGDLGPELASLDSRLAVALVNGYRQLGARCAAAGPSPGLMDRARIRQIQAILDARGYAYDAADLQARLDQCDGGRVRIDVNASWSASYVQNFFFQSPHHQDESKSISVATHGLEVTPEQGDSVTDSVTSAAVTFNESTRNWYSISCTGAGPFTAVNGTSSASAIDFGADPTIGGAIRAVVRFTRGATRASFAPCDFGPGFTPYTPRADITELYADAACAPGQYLSSSVAILSVFLPASGSASASYAGLCRRSTSADSGGDFDRQATRDVTVTFTVLP